MNILYSKFTPKEKCKLTFSVDIFLSLMASSSIGWSSFWSNIHPLLLFWPISSSVPILEAIFQLFFFFFSKYETDPFSFKPINTQYARPICTYLSVPILIFYVLFNFCQRTDISVVVVDVRMTMFQAVRFGAF